jgi:ribosomal-protein-alanine N-acetyltransferase
MEVVLELKLDRFLIRTWKPEDRASLILFASNRNIWINLRDRFPYPYMGADADQWIHQAIEETPQTHFAIAIERSMIGGIGLELGTDIFRRTAEIGYWLGEPFWGRGIATEAVRAITNYAFSTFDLCRIYAGVFEWNPASMRVLEKAGYMREGRLRKSIFKDGRIIDQFLYAMIREA